MKTCYSFIPTNSQEREKDFKVWINFKIVNSGYSAMLMDIWTCLLCDDFTQFAESDVAGLQGVQVSYSNGRKSKETLFVLLFLF